MVVLNRGLNSHTLEGSYSSIGEEGSGLFDSFISSTLLAEKSHDQQYLLISFGTNGWSLRVQTGIGSVNLGEETVTASHLNGFSSRASSVAPCRFVIEAR